MQQTIYNGEDAHFVGGATAVCKQDARHSIGAQITHIIGWAATRCRAGARRWAWRYAWEDNDEEHTFHCHLSTDLDPASAELLASQVQQSRMQAHAGSRRTR